MFNSDLLEKYPLIMRIFNEGFEDAILETQEDGYGIYGAYVQRYGVIILFVQDEQGFMSLEAIPEFRLKNILRDYARQREDED